MTAAVLLAAWAVSARAGLTPVQREPFQGGGTGGTANFPVLSGTFYARAVGPRLSRDATAAGKGWSADTRQGSQNFYTATVNGGAAAALGCASVWFWADGIGDGVPEHYHCLIQSCITTLNVDFLTVACGANGNVWYVASPSYTWVDSGITFPTHGWYELRVAWQQVSGSTYNKGAYLRAAGSSAWTTVYEAANIVNPYGNVLNTALLGIKTNTGATGNFRGRIGMPALYRMTAWSDRTAPVADVLDPPGGATTWYVDPARGNDANDGVTPSSAWRTVAKINDESLYCGLFPTAAGYGGGDTLSIDTSAANLTLGPASLDLNTRGLNVVQVGGGLTGTGEIQAWTPVPAGQWSGPVAGTTNVFQTTLTESNPACVLWEDDKWLNHPTGATLAAVQTTLANLPGSFWTDGATLFVHPFGDTNPATDGKAYTRSYARGTFGTSAVQMLVPDLHLDGLRVRKTCLADPNTNNPVLAYCIQMNGMGGGTSLIENCACGYGGKHIFGFTDNSTARRLTVRNCTANQGSPYAGAGGQTPWVDYSPLTGDADNQTTYLHCTTTASLGLIGSTAGWTFVLSTPAWFSHNNGVGRQFSLLRFVDCSFDSGLQELGSARPGAVQIVGTTCAGCIVNSSGAVVDRSKSTAWPFTAASGGIAVTNSVITGAGLYGSGRSPVQCTGSVSYVGCTADMRAVDNGDGSGTAFLNRVGPLDFTWRNNVFLGNGGSAVIGNATGTDALAFDHNAYQAGGAGSGVLLAQLQAAGQDAGSLTAADLGVGADGSLSAASPAIDLGVDLGPSADVTSTLFAVRNDAGAFEYPLPAFRRMPTGAAVTEGTSLTLTTFVAGNGPFTYQWRRNGVALPGTNAASLPLAGVLPGQSGDYSVVVTNAGGSVASDVAAVRVSPVTFSSWQGSHFTEAELADALVSGPLADPNGNGLCNLLEYAFGGDPHAPGEVGLGPVTGVATAADGVHPAVTYRRLINAVGLDYVVGVSSDLAAWDDLQMRTSLSGSPWPTGDGRTEWITAQVSQPMTATAGGRLFLRVKVIDNRAAAAIQSHR